MLRAVQLQVGKESPLTPQVERLMTRLGEDRFHLAVVGQFKRGKSSLMNAILGRALLPTGALPVTSVVTTVRYGSPVRAIVVRDGLLYPEEVPVSRVAEFITEQGNPANVKRVRSATIEAPVPFLRRGLHFIDTPGVGTADDRTTAATLAALPDADAVIFVTASDAPFSAAELQFVDRIRQDVRKFFFVVNKMDLLGNRDGQDVVAYATRVLSNRLGIDGVQLFPVSATRALAGEAGSGLAELEGALAAFLGAERQAYFLAGLLDRAIELIEALVAERGPDATIAALREHAAALCEACLSHGRLPVPERPIVPVDEGPLSAPPSRVEPAPSSAGTCVLCSAVAHAVHDFLCWYQYAIAQSVRGAQADLVTTRGLCQVHTWQLERVSSPRGLSLAFPAVVARIETDLRALAGLPVQTAAGRARGLSGKSDTCPACAVRRDVERREAARIATLCADQGPAVFSGSRWLCLTHLAMVLPALPAEHADAVIDAHARRAEEIVESMREYVIKVDARRRYLMTRDELRAYRQALVLLAGERALVSSDDDE
jgi:GTP-binding protein EngB required for normal cell division